jgi:hypothetical protein
MKSFNEWLKFRENWEEEKNPDWWKGEEDSNEEGREAPHPWNKAKGPVIFGNSVILNGKIYSKNHPFYKKYAGSKIRASAPNDYADGDSLHKTHPSVPMDRRKEMEEIYDYQDRIMNLAKNLSREKLLDILYKINPSKDFSKASDRDLSIYIFTYFPTEEKPEGYKRLMEFLKKELSS